MIEKENESERDKKRDKEKKMEDDSMDQTWWAYAGQLERESEKYK